MTINKNIDKLESYVNDLENDDVTLDDSIAIYSQALKLAKSTLDDLNTMKTKINIIQKDADLLLTKEMDIDGVN